MVDGRIVAWLALAGSATALLVVTPRPHSPRHLPAGRASKAHRLPQPPTYESVSIKGSARPTADSLVAIHPPHGWTILSSTARAGTPVKAGQAVAMARNLGRATPVTSGLSDKAFADQLSQQLGSALRSHTEQLAKAKKDLETALLERERALSPIQSELKESMTKHESESIGELARARTARDKAAKLAERNAHALEEGWISRNEAAASKVALEAAEAELARVESQAKGPSEHKDVQSLRSKLAATKSEHDSRVARAQSEVDRFEQSGLNYSGSPTYLNGRPPVTGRIARTVALRSPVDGFIMESPSGKPGVHIVKNGAKWELVANVPEPTAKKLAVAMIARTRSGAECQVVSIGPLDPKSQTRQVVVSGPFDSKGTKSVTVSILH